MTDDIQLINNPLLATSGLPDFAAILPSHIVPAVQKVLSDASKRIEEIESNLQPTWEGTIGKLETLDPPCPARAVVSVGPGMFCGFGVAQHAVAAVPPDQGCAQ